MVDYANRRASPLVDRYVTTDLPLLPLLENAPGAELPLIKALVSIQECLAGRRLAKDAIQLAQAVELKAVDPELMILFLSSWAELSCRIGRPPEAQALLHRARSLTSDDTHPEIRAATMLVESLLADITGNKARSEELLKDILRFLSPNSPRRKFYVWEQALLLCQQGRGIECQTELRNLTWQSNEQFRTLRVLLVQFVDAVETGRVQDAYPLLSQIATYPPDSLRDASRIPFRNYQLIIRLMQDRNVEGFLAPPSAHDPDTPNSVKVVRCLLGRYSEEALRIARLEANKMMNSIFGSGFESLNLVRAELACGTPEGALRIIKMRQDRGNRSYLDDLFLARAELLAGNKAAASRHFAGLLKSIEFYKARGRLDFELRMACELSPTDIVQLTRAADKVAQQTASRAGSPEGRPATPESRKELETFIGQSAAIVELRKAMASFADLETPVLITGETGTGKELVARALHEASRRSALPFVAVNCGSITETLLESELFGHERGSFTGAERTTKGLFEEAGKGTIFLDEIGDISLRLQASLLRVMETGEIRAVGSAKARTIECRVLAATNARLDDLAGKGQFREDLLYRLQRLMIHIPPLRERGDDVLLLARHFMDAGRKVGVHASMTAELRAAIRNYRWPGNVRELKNVIERMRLMHSDKLAYDLGDLDIKFQGGTAATPRKESPEPAPTPVPPAAPIPPHSDDASAPPPKAGPVGGSDVGQFLQDGKSRLRRLDRLQALFRTHGKLTRTEVVDILGISPNTATKDLKDLCDSGFIRRVEPSSSTRSHYFVLNTETTGEA